MSPSRYHPALRSLHWLIAVLVIAALFFATFVMAPHANADPAKLFMLAKHMAAGVLVLRALRGGAGCIVPSATDLLPDAGALTSAQARIEVLLRLLARRGG